MNSNLKDLLAGLNKPPRKEKQLSIKLTDSEWFNLRAFCESRYLSYSEAVRAAIQKIINHNE